jgi:hypothetical protein
VSARLIGELTAWLLSPAAEGLTPAERCILFVVAERCNDQTRVMWRFKGDELSLYDRVRVASGLGPSGLNKAFQRLANRGLEVRVKLKEGKDGRPVYSAEGHSMRFQFPALPASVELPAAPERPPSGVASDVDNSVDDPVDNSPAEGPGEPERPPSRVATEPRGRLQGSERPPSGAAINPMYPYRANPYEETPGTSSSRAEVEDDPSPRHDEDQDDGDDARLPPFDFAAASALLRTLDPVTDLRLNKMARAQLGPTAKATDVIIRAAQLASKGIPA